MSTSTLNHLPCTDPVYRACLAATAHNYGETVDAPIVTANGIVITLSSWPRQQEALRALRLLGYAVTEQPGPALLVRGWDHGLLQARAESLEHSVDQLQRWLCTLAHETLEEFIAAPEHGTDEEDLAERRAVEHAHAAARDTLEPGGHCCLAAVSERELSRAPDELRPLLIRVMAAHETVAGLIRRHMETARSAIGLYREYRHVHGYGDVEQACAKTLLDIDEGVSAFYAMASYRAEKQLQVIWEREGRTDV